MNGIFVLAAMGSFALANGVVLTNPKELAVDTIFYSLTYPSGDLNLEQEYELAPLPRKVVENEAFEIDVYVSDVKLTFSEQPQQSLSLSLDDPEYLKIEGELTFPLTEVSGDYDADLLVKSGKIISHFTGSGDFKLTAQSIGIKIVATLTRQSPELLAVKKLEVGAIEFPDGADFTATGARLNGIPWTEEDVQRKFKDGLPLVIFVTQPGVKLGLKAAIDKALARQTFSEWNSEHSGDGDGY